MERCLRRLNLIFYSCIGSANKGGCKYAKNRNYQGGLGSRPTQTYYKKKLNQITIKDITNECGISRNAFYYHFSDKYDLVNWIFISQTLPVINTFSAPDRYFDGFVALCRHMLEDKQFYMEAFRYSGQNSLWETLTESYYELIKIHISTVYAQIGYRLTADELFITARLETHAYVGIIREWVHDGMNENYLSYFEQLKRIKAGLAFPLDPSLQNHNIQP